MSILEELEQRAESKCELCGSAQTLRVFNVPPASEDILDRNILACAKCADQLAPDAILDPHHWRCLSQSMWSQIPAVQVVAWRMLNRLAADTWAQDALDMLYLNDETLAWAKSGASPDSEPALKHLDAHGAALFAGDTVTLIKDLQVKGAGFTAKRGTAVRNISLVPENEKHIEGRINGQQIVILTGFVKKST